jgi:hypothetical protein
MQTCQTISFEELSLSPPFSFSAAVVSPQIIAVSFGTLISISRPIRIQENLLREISPAILDFALGEIAAGQWAKLHNRLRVGQGLQFGLCLTLIERCPF